MCKNPTSASRRILCTDWLQTMRRAARLVLNTYAYCNARAGHIMRAVRELQSGRCERSRWKVCNRNCPVCVIWTRLYSWSVLARSGDLEAICGSRLIYQQFRGIETMPLRCRIKRIFMHTTHDVDRSSTGDSPASCWRYWSDSFYSATHMDSSA